MKISTPGDFWWRHQVKRQELMLRQELQTLCRTRVIDRLRYNLQRLISKTLSCLTLAVLVVWTFLGVLGGGRFYAQPPSNSAPEVRSDIRQAAFESSSKITKKVLRSFLRSGQRSGQQRSSKVKCSRFSTISTILNFRRSSS